jgi:transposase
MTKRRKFSDQF